MVERFYGPLTGFEMRPGERGDYVRYSDYAALKTQLAEAREAMELAHTVLAQSITTKYNLPGPTPKDIEKAFWALDAALEEQGGDNG